MTAKNDDDLPFRAYGLNRSFQVSDGKTSPNCRRPQFIGHAVLDPNLSCAVNFGKTGHEGKVGGIDRWPALLGRGRRRPHMGAKKSRDTIGSR